MNEDKLATACTFNVGSGIRLVTMELKHMSHPACISKSTGLLPAVMANVWLVTTAIRTTWCRKATGDSEDGGSHFQLKQQVGTDDPTGSNEITVWAESRLWRKDRKTRGPWRGTIIVTGNSQEMGRQVCCQHHTKTQKDHRQINIWVPRTKGNRRRGRQKGTSTL